MKKKKVRVFVIGNYKGGIGTSFTTINLATSLSVEFNKNICVVECNRQKSISKIRNKEQKENPDLTPPYPVVYSQAKLLPGLLLGGSLNYDYIFIDMPRMIIEDDNSEKEQEGILNLLLLAESILIPISARELDLDGANGFVDLINELKEYRAEKKLPFTFFAFGNRSRGIKEEEIIPAWAKASNIALFDNTVKESVHLARNLSTFASTESVNDPAAKTAVKNYKKFIGEFINKFDILIDYGIN